MYNDQRPHRRRALCLLILAVNLAFFASVPVWAGEGKPALLIRGTQHPYNVDLIERSLKRQNAVGETVSFPHTTKSLTDYGLIVIDGIFSEQMSPSAEFLDQLARATRQGSTVLCFRNAIHLFDRTPAGRDFLKPILRTLPRSETKLTFLTPNHPWVGNFDYADSAWLQTDSVQAVAALAGERIIGAVHGPATVLLDCPRGKGRFIYVGWDIFRMTPNQDADKTTFFRQKKRHQHMLEMLDKIVAAQALTTLEDQWRRQRRKGPAITPSARAKRSPANELYVDGVNGRDDQIGSRQEPFKTLPFALRNLGPGDTLFVHATMTYPLPDFLLLKGTAQQPITIRSAPGERAIFDGGLPEFAGDGAPAWERVTDGHPEEWRSIKPVSGKIGINAAFIDSNIRVLTYDDLNDLRADNEYFSEISHHDPRPGMTVKLKPHHRERRYPWTYYGPGVYHNPNDGHVHIRLSHTNLDAPGIKNYRGERNPNRLKLAITPAARQTVIGGCEHLQIKDLVFRNGGARTIDFQGDCRSVIFSHVDIFPGKVGVRMTNAEGCAFLHCVVDGGVPPWTTRAETKQGYIYRTAAGKQKMLGFVGNTSKLLFAIDESVRDLEIANCEFRNAHDGLYLLGTNTHFHHNLVEDVHDDTFYMGGPKGDNIHIYQNVIRHVLQGFSFSEYRSGITGGPRYIYRNLIDLRMPTRGYRRPMRDGGPWRYGADFKMNLPVDPIYCYHNTFVVSSRGPHVGSYLWSNITPDQKEARHVLNNIHVTTTNRLAFTHVPPHDTRVRSAGNLWHRPASNTTSFISSISGVGPFVDLKSAQGSPWAAALKKHTGHAWEARSIMAAPKFMAYRGEHAAQFAYPNDDLRLHPDSPAVAGGVELPKDWPDPMRVDGKVPDIGCYPFNAAPLRVGVNGRQAFPDPQRVTVDAGSNQQLVDEDNDGGEMVNIEATATTDGQFTWYRAGERIAQGRSAAVRLPVGTHHLTVRYAHNKTTAEDVLTVHVQAKADASQRVRNGTFEATDSWQISNGNIFAAAGQDHSRGLVLTPGNGPTSIARQHMRIDGGQSYAFSGWLRVEGYGGATIQATFVNARGKRQQVVIGQIKNELVQPTATATVDEPDDIPELEEPAQIAPAPPPPPVQVRQLEKTLTAPAWANALELAVAGNGSTSTTISADNLSIRGPEPAALTQQSRRQP